MPYTAGKWKRSGIAGKMRQVFTVINYARAANDLGAGGALTKTTIYTGIRGRLDDLSSSEKERNAALEMDTTHQIQIWARGVTIKPGYVLELDGTTRTFEIKGIQKFENRDDLIGLTVLEIGVVSR